jgi:hypothetical protein
VTRQSPSVAGASVKAGGGCAAAIAAIPTARIVPNITARRRLVIRRSSRAQIFTLYRREA